MDAKQLNEIANLLTGVKKYEWSRIKIAIDRMYDSASNKISLKDTEAIRRNIYIEMSEIIS